MMWTDEHISTQLLETHLSQDTDLASRREGTISSTVQWILEQVPGEGLNILDLGCGPGLYAERLARAGHRVTGMDVSANSLSYAKKSAQSNKLAVSYLQQDYLELTAENSYDLILLIFTDFGVLVPEQRTHLLNKIYRALKPGGTFLFDVLNHNGAVTTTAAKDWELSLKGFWRDSPYLALSESFYYEEEQVSLNQHTIIDEDGGREVYRFWIHTFSQNDLAVLLSAAGFRTTACSDGVLPDSELYGSEAVTFCLASK
ncbi:class I SAM-dependent methyltransferase [Desulfogranum mediterraneum]|uniref:class I SAM-dependent methyltransferase n=1 Tax=Desulfogranum mediterraneum TaxID=160661 RepID=UPI00137767C7|nr:class I SAM-dependent methyltransferase [Desulfogranum mediterraneum]